MTSRRAAAEPHVMRNELTQRNSLLLFGLIFLTAGLCAPVWVYLMNRDVQRVDSSQFPNLGRITLIALLYPVSLTAHGYVIDAGLSFSVILVVRLAIAISWLALVWLFFGGIVAVGRYVRAKGVQVPGTFALVALTFIFVFSLPLLQRALNTVASRKVPMRVASNVVPNA
jgi:hypothetical protein